MARVLQPLNVLGQDQSFEVFGTTLTIHVGLPFSWKIFYVSAVFLAASSLLYQVFCPRLIKDLDGNRQAIGGVDLNTIQRYIELMRLGEQELQEAQSQGVNQGGRAWDIGEGRRPGARLLCGFGYMVGLGLIAWIVGQGVVSVFPLLFS